MKRREALSSVGLILGGTIIGSHAFLAGCSPSDSGIGGLPLSESQIALLNEVGETILPKTEKTPGAKEVNVGSFMDAIVTDFYSKEEQTIFLNGMKSLNSLSDDQFGKGFIELSSDDRTTILMLLEKEAGESLKNTTGNHYYIMMKQLTIWGYLSSEVVAFNAFNHMVLTPKFEGCVPFEKGDKVLFGEAGQGQAYGYATHHMRRKNKG